MSDIMDGFQSNVVSNTTSGGLDDGRVMPVECESSDTAQPEMIEVEQVLGVEMQQKVLDVALHLPEDFPIIDHVIDVYVKNVKVESITVLLNKVVIRGTLCVKVMYTVAGDDSRVVVFEKRGVKFTRDIDVDGACPNMKATADVRVEYMHYDFDSCKPRHVDVTVVLKIWTRVTTVASLAVMAMPGVDVVGDFDNSTVEGCDTESEVGVDEMTAQGVEEAGLKNGYVTGNRVNLRTGPGTNYPSLRLLSRGERVRIQEQAFGWYKVVLPETDVDGWIAGWFIEIAE